MQRLELGVVARRKLRGFSSVMFVGIQYVKLKKDECRFVGSRGLRFESWKACIQIDRQTYSSLSSLPLVFRFRSLYD